MAEITARVTDLLEVLHVYGLAAILEQETGSPAELGWISDSVAQVECAGLSDGEAATLVQRHASRHARASSWVQTTGKLDGADRGALSPRVGRILSRQTWRDWHKVRLNAIDLVQADDVLSQRFIGALGEPAYWLTGKESKPDRGASAWEMKTRNRGEDFTRNRLALLAGAVAARQVSDVEAGIRGVYVADEVGKDSQTSRTPTGLRRPGLADNVVAWCALWGLSYMPTRPVVPRTLFVLPRSRTAGVTVLKRTNYLAVPIPRFPVSTARLRAVTRSAALTSVVEQDLRQGGVQPPQDDAKAVSDLQWLLDHGIIGVTVARKEFSDNANAPEPWAVVEKFSLLSEQFEL